MGYYTRYDLSVRSGDFSITDILTSEKAKGLRGLNYAIDINGDCYDSVKWYDHKSDMCELSKRFPDVVFELFGKGEENDDMWKKYFKNGKMQACYAKITFDEYDEKELK